MAGDTLFVFVLIGVSLLFASGRVRLDMVPLGVPLALALSGVLTAAQAVSGFGDPVVILVAGLLVLGEALTHTGVARAIGAWLLRVGGTGEVRLMVLLMAVGETFPVRPAAAADRAPDGHDFEGSLRVP